MSEIYRCEDCKHCPKNWHKESQLPLCHHPEAIRINGRPAWALYAIHDGHCGVNRKNFEERIKQ